jgi:hypothetical protein
MYEAGKKEAETLNPKSLGKLSILLVTMHSTVIHRFLKKSMNYPNMKQKYLAKTVVLVLTRKTF